MKLKATIRKKTVRNKANTNQFIPGIIYGKNVNNIKINLDNHMITNVCNHPFSKTKIYDMEIEESSDAKVINVFIKEIHKSTITDTILHIDFIQIIKDQSYNFTVPIIFIGIENSPGIKKGAILNVIHDTIKVTCQPNILPEKLLFDISQIDVGNKIQANQIVLPSGCKLFKEQNIKMKNKILASLVGKSGKTETEEVDENNTEDDTDKKD